MKRIFALFFPAYSVEAKEGTLSAYTIEGEGNPLPSKDVK